MGVTYTLSETKALTRIGFRDAEGSQFFLLQPSLGFCPNRLDSASKNWGDGIKATLGMDALENSLLNLVATEL